MKKQTTIIFFALLIGFKSYSQIGFEKGYFVNESDKKVECLIKNVDWKNNPVKFEYKITPDDSVHTAYITGVREFGIDGFSKYVRAEVEIDRSGDLLDELDYNRNPVFRKEVLFLNVLVEGKASLYGYENGNIRRFFYRNDSSEIKQLVYKRYMSEEGTVGKNNLFRMQIFLDLKCEGITQSDLENLSYSKGDLAKLFIKYNESTNTDYNSFYSRASKDVVNLSLLASLDCGSLSIINADYDAFGEYFNNVFSLRSGLDIEYVLPYNKNKWAITLDPTLAYIRARSEEETTTVSGGILVTKVNYFLVEIPLGLRHYFYLNNDCRLFLDASVVMGFSNKESLKFLRDDGSVINTYSFGSTKRYWNIGAGCKFKEKYTVEVEFEPSHNIMHNYAFWRASYQTLSVMFGYTFN